MKKYKKNYIPGSMSFSDGFMGPKFNVGYTMVVDESKAKKIIKKLIKEGRKIEEAALGLDGDWGCNSTVIYDGAFHEYNAYGRSVWATPILIVTFEDGPSETHECYKKSKLT